MKKISVATKILSCILSFLSIFTIFSFGTKARKGVEIEFNDCMEYAAYKQFMALKSEHPCKELSFVEKLFLVNLYRMKFTANVYREFNPKRKVMYALREAVSKVYPIIDLQDFIGIKLVCICCNKKFTRVIKYMLERGIDYVCCRSFESSGLYKFYPRFYLVDYKNDNKKEIPLAFDV